LTKWSPYARSYKVPFNLAGIDSRLLFKYSMTGGALATAAGIFAVFFFSDIPRVRKDIMQKIPVIGDHFVKEIPASDNPF